MVTLCGFCQGTLLREDCKRGGGENIEVGFLGVVKKKSEIRITPAVEKRGGVGRAEKAK